MNTITIEDAFVFIINNNKNIPFDTVVIGFDTNKLTTCPEKSVYNHNYYLYDNKYLLLEEYNECDNSFCYSLILNDNQYILGFTEWWYHPEILTLYPY